MSRGIPVVAHVSSHRSVDGVVFPQPDVLAGEPFRAALPEDDVAGDDVLGGGAFEAEAAAGGVGGAVGAPLGRVGGVSGLLGVGRGEGEGWVVVVGDEIESCEGCDEGGEGGRRGGGKRVGDPWL